MQQHTQLNHPVYIQKKKSVWPWIIAGLLIVMLAGGLLISLVANIVLIKGSARKGAVRVGRDRFSEVLVEGEGDNKGPYQFYRFGEHLEEREHGRPGAGETPGRGGRSGG